MEAGDQAFRHHRADLLGREVHDRHDLPADQLLRRVKGRDLRTGLAHADVGPEVDVQDVGRFPRLWKRLGTADPADAQLDLAEVVPADFPHVQPLAPASSSGPATTGTLPASVHAPASYRLFCPTAPPARQWLAHLPAHRWP